MLVKTDHFRKYAIEVPTRKQTGKTTVEAFYNNFIIHYDIATNLHPDQGANFESKIIKEHHGNLEEPYKAVPIT